MKRYRSGVFIAFLALAGCGQMGPLILPTPEPNPAPAAAPVTVQPLIETASSVAPSAPATK